MVIVHLLAPARAGGLERVVHGLAIGQRARGHEVSVVAVVEESLAGHPFVGPLERSGVPVLALQVPPRRYWRERAGAKVLCQQLAPQVVHSHGYRTDVVDGGVLHSLGLAVVSTAHGFTRGPWRNRFYERLHQRALRRFDAVIAVSRPLAAQLIASGVPERRVHLIPNAWSEIAAPLTRAEARRALGLPDDPLVVGWIGRMTPEKGLDVFLDAAARLADLPFLVCAIGDGPERARQESRVGSLGTRVRWVGFRPEAGRLCRAFDAFVLSSRSEGIPMALLEAVAAGVPVVATRVGGVPEILGQADALLVPPEQPEALARALRATLADSAAARRRAAAAAERLARDHGPGAWLDAHDAVYAAALRQATRRSGKAIGDDIA